MKAGERVEKAHTAMGVEMESAGTMRKGTRRHMYSACPISPQAA